MGWGVHRMRGREYDSLVFVSLCSPLSALHSALRSEPLLLPQSVDHNNVRPSLLARYLANRCQYTARAYVLPNLPRADTSSGWHSGWRRIGSREARLSRSHATSDKGCRAGLASARLSTSLRECKLTKRELVSSCKQSPRSACSGSRELRGGRVERVPGFVWEQGV